MLCTYVLVFLLYANIWSIPIVYLLQCFHRVQPYRLIPLRGVRPSPNWMASLLYHGCQNLFQMFHEGSGVCKVIRAPIWASAEMWPCLPGVSFQVLKAVYAPFFGFCNLCSSSMCQSWPLCCHLTYLLSVTHEFLAYCFPYLGIWSCFVYL